MPETAPSHQMPSLPGMRLGRLKDLPENVAEGLGERQELLDMFANDPENPDIWNYAATKALDEEAEGTGQPEDLQDIPAGDLIEFARAVQATPPKDRYALTTANAPNGKRWFDVLYGFHNPSGNEAIARSVGWHLREAGKDKAGVIVDLGAGTGETAAAVAPYAEQVIGVDGNPALLGVAREEQPDIEFIEGDVTKLPFADGSVDVITSNGLKYALDGEQSVKMYSEIARVLKEGGVYIDADWRRPKDIALSVGGTGRVEHPDFHPQELAQFATWRAVLQDMIVDTVSGKFEKSDTLEMEGRAWQAFRAQLGLREQQMRVDDGSFSSQLAYTRILQKAETKAPGSE